MREDSARWAAVVRSSAASLVALVQDSQGVHALDDRVERNFFGAEDGLELGRRGQDQRAGEVEVSRQAEEGLHVAGQLEDLLLDGAARLLLEEAVWRPSSKRRASPGWSSSSE